MFTLLTIFALTQAPALAGDPEDAATMLSRFPAGAVPEVPAVMEAIEALSRTGRDEHLPLLQSLVLHERSMVGLAAMRAMARISGSTLLAEAHEAAPRGGEADELPPVPVGDDR
jgi:hypothetical protein